MTYGTSNFEQYDDGSAPSFRMTHAVQRLILLNAAIFAVQLLVNIPLGRPAFLVFSAPPGGIAIDWLAFKPTDLLRGYIWQPFTYMFLHAGLSHLFMNMIGLFFFGPDVERVLSTRQFYRFFILCGALGVSAEFVLWGLRLAVQGGDAPVMVPSVIGASGATMGVLVAFATLYPNREMYLFPIPIRLTARAVVIIFIVLNLMSALSASNISWATHFGGMAVGYLYIKLVPRIRAWFDRRQHGAEPPQDKLGEAVDNIFRFDEEKKRRK